MKKSASVVLLVLIALLARPQFILAQATPAPVRGSWEDLKTIPTGDQLMIDLRNGQRLKGRLISHSETSLNLDRDRKSLNVDRGEILKVHRLIPKSAKRSALIGLGVGAAVGGLGGGLAAASGPGESGEYGWGVLIFGAIGVGMGSLVGYIIGSRQQRVLVYETK